MLVGHVLSAWRYRGFIFSAIRSEMKGRFASSKIGGLWFVLHPLAMAAIYALVLSRLVGARLGGVDNPAAFPIYLISGLAIWSLFSEIVNRCLSIFLEYANAMKKISFPRVALPFIVLGGALINHGFLLGAAIVVFAFLGHFPAPAWLALPLALVVGAGFAFGLGVFLGVLNVFARDVGQAMSVVMQLWFWMTPIIYPLDILPEGIRAVIELNPMTSVVEFYHEALVYQQWPDITMLAYPASLGLALIALSVATFRRASPEIVDVL